MEPADRIPYISNSAGFEANMYFGNDILIPSSAVSGHIAAMATKAQQNAATAAAELDLDEFEESKQQEPEALSGIGLQIQRRMTLKSLEIDDVVAAINKRKNLPKPIKNAQIIYLRTSKATKPEEIRGAKLLGEVAAVLECSVADLFAPIDDSKPAVQPSNENDSELIRMAEIALNGPKADFVRDAIEMAYSAALTSRRRSY